MFFFLLLLPALYIGLTLYLKTAMGPFWLGSNIDPAYQYLMNGLNILQGLAPAHVDHPGTTLQLVTAGVIRVMAGFRDHDALLEHVFHHPEVYLHAVWLVLLILSAASMVLIGWQVYRYTRHVLAALIVQLPTLLFVSIKSNFFSEAILTISLNVSPEHLLIPIGNLTAMFFLSLLYHRDQQTAWWKSALLGVIVTAGLITKLTFLPMFLAALLFIKGVGARILLVFSSMMTFFLLTWPIQERYQQWGTWVFKNATHAGQHGSGQAAVVDWHAFFHHLSTIISANMFFTLFLFLNVSFLVSLGLVYFKKQLKDQRLLRYALWLTFVFVTQLILVSRSYMSLHYMVPVVAMLGCVMVMRRLTFSAAWFNITAGFMVVLGVVFSVAHTVIYHPRFAQREHQLRQFREEVVANIEEGCLVVPYYRASDPKYALKFGLYAFQSDPYDKYVSHLSTLFQNPFHVNKWSMNILDWRMKYYFGSMYQQMAQHVPCVLFHGTAPLDPNIVETEVVVSSENEYEHVYRVTKINSKK